MVEAKERAKLGFYGKKGAYAQAYGLFNVAWAAGTMVGTIWSGYIKPGLDGGLRLAVWACLGLLPRRRS